MVDMIQELKVDGKHKAHSSRPPNAGLLVTAIKPITLPAIPESARHAHTHGQAGEKIKRIRQNSWKESAVTTPRQESASDRGRRHRTISSEKDTTGSYVVSVGNKSAPVFISCHSAYTGRGLKIQHALEAKGIPCWMTTENVVGNVQDAIGEALMVAPAIIICFSHTYRMSMYKFKFKIIHFLKKYINLCIYCGPYFKFA